jgi:HAE1 family hydrophobic/amphiphilic exporter-1/multidrug efflux pump
VEFNLGVDLEAAASYVRDKLARLRAVYPRILMLRLVVSKADANSDPILILALQKSHQEFALS